MCFCSCLCSRWFKGGLLLVVALLAPRLRGDQVLLKGYQAGADPVWRQTVTNSASASLEHAGNYGQLNGQSTVGMLKQDLACTADQKGAGYVSFTGYWQDTINIEPEDSSLKGAAATAVFSLHVSGSQSVSGFLDYGDDNFYLSPQYNGPSIEGHINQPGGFWGTPLDQLGTVTWTQPCTLGGQVAIWVSLSTTVDGTLGSPASATENITVTYGGFTVTNNSGPIAYRASSSLGTARSLLLTNQEPYADFSLTNSTGNQTMLGFLAGNAQSNELLTATFVPNPSTNQLNSDVVHLNIAHMSPALSNRWFLIAMTFIGKADFSALLRYDETNKVWNNAVLGNSDGGKQQKRFSGMPDLNTQFQLGNYGVDTNHGIAWAVLDHNSLFAVGPDAAAPPTPQWTGAQVSPTGGFSLTASGPPNAGFTIEFSSNLTLNAWTSIGSLVFGTNGIGSFIDTNSVLGTSPRFYRLRKP